MRKINTKKKLTETQENFCELYARHAGDINKICISLHITPSRATQILEHPLVKERIARSVERARQKIEAATPHLVNLALEMVNDPDLNPKIKASLLDSLLDRAGVA